MIMGRFDEAEEEYKHSLELLITSLLYSQLLDDQFKAELYELNKLWIMIKRRDFQSSNQTIELQNKLSTNDGKLIKAILLYKQRDYHSSLSLLHQY